MKRVKGRINGQIWFYTIGTTTFPFWQFFLNRIIGMKYIRNLFMNKFVMK